MADMFASARIRLTLWYLLIIVLITSSLSGVIYVRVSSVLEQEYIRIEQRLQQEWPGVGLQSRPGFGRRITPQDLRNAQSQIAGQLIIINLIIIVFFAAAGYFLSGKTLKPIEEIHEEQKRFIGDAAHELKTPITALKTSLEVNLMDRALDKKTKKILKENLEDVTSLESLSQSLLRLAKVTDQQLIKKPLNLTKIVTRGMEYLEATAQKKEITIQLEKGKTKYWVWGDEGALLDLVLILLDNALKYSPKRSVIKVKLNKRKNQVLLEVTDFGSGISHRDLPHIFERFYRADQTRGNYQHHGYGLGLSVAQKIVDQHGGQIMVTSAVRKGSTFSVWLPSKG